MLKNDKMHKNNILNNYALPTGNLDSKTSMDVILLMQSLSHEFDQTILMITHNEEIARMADRIIRIEDGKVLSGGVRYAR